MSEAVALLFFTKSVSACKPVSFLRFIRDFLSKSFLNTGFILRISRKEEKCGILLLSINLKIIIIAKAAN